MPVDKQVLLRYQVLNKCFRSRYREYTIEDLLDECNKALRSQDKPEVSKRTIQNDITTLETDYGIRLQENLKRGRQRLYRYYDLDYSLPLIRIDDEERNKIQAAIDVLEDFEGEPLYDWTRSFLMQVESGLLNDSPSPLVTFQSNPDLKGISHFPNLLQAIRTKRVLKLRYTPYGKDTQTITIYPYHLKQFNDRWYLIAQAKGYETFAHYALDRIDSYEEVALPYKDSDVDFSEYFDDVIGVTVSDGDAEDIVIKVTGKRFNYIRTKPLHLSQRIIEEAEGYAVISINVKVNKELESLILSFGDDMEIIAPASFRDRIAEKIQAMNKKYLNNAENLHSK
jgi:predicted DNA-binding transcriptional regulator YafY